VRSLSSRSLSSRSRRLGTAAAVLVAASLVTVGAGTAADASPAAAAHTARPTVVLVHGAWADGASFGSIGRRLRGDGYTVVDFATPLRSLSGDSAALDAFLAVRTTGPVVLVGHSYGGAVITEAATSDPDVRALVYVDAFAPAAGESVLGLVSSATSGNPAAEFDAVPAGATSDLYLKQDAFDATFATGLPEGEQQDLFARQEPVTLTALTEAATTPAWKTLPSWYVAGTEDGSVPIALQERMAARAHAHLTTVRAGHLAMLQQPGTITRVVEDAATSTR